MAIELEELRTFTLIVDAGTLSAAAKILRLTTNAVSHRLTRLEHHCGVTLLQRTTRSLSLTEEGRRLYAHAQRMLQLLDLMESDLRPRRTALEGTVRLALPIASLDFGFFSRLAEMLDAHPRLAIQVRATHEPLDAVKERIDIELVVEPPKGADRILRKLGTVSWVLAASRSYLDRHGRPSAATDLAQHRCLRLLGSRSQDVWNLRRSDGRELLVPVGGAFECDDSRALGDAMHAGLGIGVCDARDIERSQGQLERVLPDYWFGSLPLYATIAPGRLRIPRVRLVLSLLEASLRERLEAGARTRSRVSSGKRVR